MRTRLRPEERQEQLLDAAIQVAFDVGWDRITQQLVASYVGCSPSLVCNYWPTIVELKATVMRAAVRREIISILAQGLAMRDSTALAAPPALRVQAAAWLAK